MAESTPSVVVLGAGPSGLSAAWTLARHGHHITVVEKESTTGGLAATKSRDGFLYDIGPHNIHTRHAHILAFLRRTFPDALEARPITSQIRKRGELVPYPLKGLRVLTSLPASMIPFAAASFATARLRMFLGEPTEDGSFEAWIRNRFGGVLFQEYFCEYPEKVWGLPARQIDRIVGEKRIPVIGITELVRAAILGRPMRIDHPEFVSENFYMRKGVGEICEFFEAECVRMGVRFLKSCRAERIDLSGPRVAAVHLTDGSRLSCDFLLSTIPIDRLIAAVPSAPEEVRDAAAALEYRSSLLVFLCCSTPTNWNSSMVYFAEREIPFSRVSDAGQLSPTMVPSGRTLLCLEAPCHTTDPIWSRSEAELVQDAVELLDSTGLFQRENVTSGFVERISHSYPLFRTGFGDRKRTIDSFTASIPGLLSFGRQGGFSYINTDEALNHGFRAATAVLMTHATGGTCTDWFRVHE